MSTDATVRARASGRSDATLVTNISTGPFSITADEPVAVGGTETGPSPFQLAASALVACTAMTVRLYAQRKGFPVTTIDVSVEVLKADADQGRPRDAFVRKLTLGGDLTDEQKQKCVEIAKKCPVGRLLEGGADVPTSLA